MSFLDATGRSLIGVGVYTLPQVATLVRLPKATVDSIVGPTPDDDTPPRAYPIAIAELDLGEGEKIITFQGLMDLWVAARLRRHNIPWPVIRLAAYHGSRILKTLHPFTTGTFRMESKKVFLSLQRIREKPKTAIDLLNQQQVFEDVIEQSLTDDFAVRDKHGRIAQLFPMGSKVKVVLDPERRFGEPIDPDSGVPVKALAGAYHAEKGNAAVAARWFDVSKKAILDAVAFEEWLNKS
jgi:uncharacterized protein (DUF433 family)